MKLHEMKEKRNNIAKQMRALHEEIGDKTWNQDQEKRWGDMSKEHDDLEVQISREERLLSLDASALDTGGEQRSAGAGDEPERRAAFNAFVRGGFENLDQEQRALLREMRAMGTTPDDKGGYTIPKEFRDRVVDTMKQFGGLANIATVFETDNGNPIQWVTTDGSAEEGAMIAEQAESDKGDINFGQVSLGAKKMTSKIVLISNELLQDSGIDIEGLIGRRLGTRIGRGEARQLVSGDGTGNNIKGLLYQAQTGKTTVATTAITYDELLDLKHSVDPAYRMGTAHWLFNDSTLLALKKLKDSQGRPLWLPDIAGVTPATIDSDPYQIDQAMPAISAGAKAIGYGDFSAVQIRRVRYMQLKRLVEKYAEFDQTGFLMFHRFDAVLEDLAAVKLLALHA